MSYADEHIRKAERAGDALRGVGCLGALAAIGAVVAAVILAAC